jgi:hypothetical protein
MTGEIVEHWLGGKQAFLLISARKIFRLVVNRQNDPNNCAEQFQF